MTEQETTNPKPHRHWLLYIVCLAALLVSAKNVYDIQRLGEYRAYKWEVQHLKERVDDMKPMVDSLDNLAWFLQYERHNKGIVDLTHQGYTRLDETFLFAGATVTQHLTGVKVGGRIINTSSIIHKNPGFRIMMVGGRNTFTISRISPGNSTTFTVYVPNVSIEDSETAWITHETGSINYNR